MAAISKDAAKRIEAAFEAAQARAAAPIAGVVAERSGDYLEAPLALILLVALAAPWPLLWMTRLPVERILLAPVGAVIVGLAIFASVRARVRLTGPRGARALAHHAALTQFSTRIGLHRDGASGVLIYISLAEHYARVVAGPEAAKAIPQPAWQGLIDRLTRAAAKGDPVDALCAAAGEAADMLAPHFPPSASEPSRGTRFHGA